MHELPDEYGKRARSLATSNAKGPAEGAWDYLWKLYYIGRETVMNCYSTFWYYFKLVACNNLQVSSSCDREWRTDDIDYL